MTGKGKVGGKAKDMHDEEGDPARKTCKAAQGRTTRVFASAPFRASKEYRVTYGGSTHGIISKRSNLEWKPTTSI